jgi:hypothetical protein
MQPARPRMTGFALCPRRSVLWSVGPHPFAVAGTDRTDVQEMLHPIIHKAPVLKLRIALRDSGLCLGDPAELAFGDDGEVGVFAQARKRGLIFMRQRRLQLGVLGPQATAIVAGAVQRGDPLRVRIVGLTPEHLARERRPDLHVSVWGHLRHLLGASPDLPVTDEEAPPATN